MIFFGKMISKYHNRYYFCSNKAISYRSNQLKDSKCLKSKRFSHDQRIKMCDLEQLYSNLCRSYQYCLRNVFLLCDKYFFQERANTGIEPTTSPSHAKLYVGVPFDVI